MDSHCGLLKVAFGLCIVMQSAALKHETVVLSHNRTQSNEFLIDGATVMSEENYRITDSRSVVIIVPSNFDCRLMVQFVYIDLPREKPCQDYIGMCEVAKGWYAPQCGLQMIHSKFCGTLEELPRSMLTRGEGNSIMITFHANRPHGNHRGFKFIITSFSYSSFCGARGHFQCDDGRCISSDLHCDGIPHCLDGTDEIKNCSQKNGLVPIPYCGPHDQNPLCRHRRWGERWFGLAIPMAIVMVLLFFAIAVKVRKQVCHPMPLGGSSRDRLHVAHRRERAVQAPPLPHRPVIGPGWICPHERLSDPSLPPPEVDIGFVDAATLMLLPPPYSPPEDRPNNPYDPPTEGEPPPLYEDSLHHTLQSEKAIIMAPSDGPEGTLQTSGGTTVQRPNPPAYHMLPPSLTPPTDAAVSSASTSGSMCCPSTLVVTSTGEITLVPARGQMSAAQMGLMPVPNGRSPSPSPQSPNAEFSL